jgi:hypothetical protein
VVVWLWEVALICVGDNSWVIGGLRPGHPVPGGLRFRAVPRRVRSLRREIGSKTCAAAVPVLDPDHACHCRGPGGDNLDGEGPHQWGAGWQCYALAADCGCPDRSLTTKVLSMFGWTTEGPWVSSGTRPCVGGAPWIWHIFQIAGRAPGGSWVGPRCSDCKGRQPEGH